MPDALSRGADCDFDVVLLVAIAVEAGKSNVVLFRTSSAGDRNPVIKLDFIIFEMRSAMLARVVVSPHYSDFNLKGNVPAASGVRARLGYGSRGKEDRTDMPKYIA